MRLLTKAAEMVAHQIHRETRYWGGSCRSSQSADRQNRFSRSDGRRGDYGTGPNLLQILEHFVFIVTGRSAGVKRT